MNKIYFRTRPNTQGRIELVIIDLDNVTIKNRFIDNYQNDFLNDAIIVSKKELARIFQKFFDAGFAYI